MSRVAPHWILFYDYVEDVLERRAPHREGHLGLIRGWKGDGRIVMAGALGDPPHGAAIVFAVDDPAEIEQFTAADPYLAAGLVADRRVDRWTLV